jgi:hypothetical protein
MRRMKNLILMIGIFISIKAFAQYQDLPRAEFLTDRVNFGGINADDGPVTYKFRFVNIGRAPLKILDVITSCGCTTPQWTKSEIKSYDTGEIIAVFNPEGKDGSFLKTLTVNTNGSPGAFSLTLEGAIYSGDKDLWASFPHKMGGLRFSTKQIEFPAVKEDKLDTVWISVYNPTDKTITIRSVAGPAMIKGYATNKILLPKHGEDIMFTYNGTLVKELGTRIDSVQFGTTDGYKIIPVKANIVQNFDKLTAEQKAKKPVINYKVTEGDLGQLYQGESGTYTYEISNTGKSDLVIRKIMSDCKCVTWSMPQQTIKKGGKAKITVTLNTARTHHDVSKKVTIYSNDFEKPLTILKIKAYVVIPGKDRITY